MGGGIEWITPTLSSDNKTATCSWDYDADTIIILYTTSTFSAIHMYDLALNTLWYANTTYRWESYSPITWMTFTPRSLVFNCPQNVAMTNVTVIPIKGKPNGYFN